MMPSLKKSAKTFGAVTLVALTALGFYAWQNMQRGNGSVFSFLPNFNDNIQEPQQLLVAGDPVKLEIPSINVKANIEAAGLAPDGTVAVPKGPNGVTWYKFGAKPGELGSAVVTGHFGPWRSGAKSVFDNLGNLKAGDRVLVTDAKGETFEFEVKKTQIYQRNDKVPEIFTKHDKAYLNLITCNGEWLSGQRTYDQRLVVFTELVK